MSTTNYFKTALLLGLLTGLILAVGRAVVDCRVPVCEFIDRGVQALQ